jgi:hypothetical protein
MRFFIVNHSLIKIKKSSHHYCNPDHVERRETIKYPHNKGRCLKESRMMLGVGKTDALFYGAAPGGLGLIVDWQARSLSYGNGEAITITPTKAGIRERSWRGLPW